MNKEVVKAHIKNYAPVVLIAFGAIWAANNVSVVRNIVKKTGK